MSWAIPWKLRLSSTTGDKILDVALAKVGTKGMFTKEIEEALADKRVDLAVHSLKDVPTELQPEFTLAAIMKREDPRDAFISVNYERLEDLPKKAKVGTSSLRRQCQLKAMRHDLEIFPLRGNVDTRLRKLESGEYDAIILAAAGVKRLALDKHVRSWIEPELMCPAVGQGALAVEARSSDTHVLKYLEFLNHPETRIAIECDARCWAALVAMPGSHWRLCRKARWTLHLRAMVGRPDGSEILREFAQGTEPEQLGRETAQSC